MVGYILHYLQLDISYAVSSTILPHLQLVKGTYNASWGIMYGD